MRKHYYSTLLCAFLMALFTPLTEGVCSGISVTSPSVGALSGGSTTVTFNISWNYSWRNASSYNNNWDAAWVFVKFRKNSGDWAHASLNDTGHSIPSGGTSSNGLVDPTSAFNIATNPVVGVFIYRSADGAGTFTLNGVSLSWNYSQDGVTGSDAVEVQIFAIEMVYIPDGAFFAGDNASSTSSFKQGSSDQDPWYIGSEGAITTTNTAGSGTGVAETAAEYYYVKSTGSYGGEDTTGTVFTIPAAFPKGYQKFYMMKGEISQEQWVRFFNTLTATQKSTRDITSLTGKNTDALTYRNNVSWSSGDATLPDQGGGATYEDVACNYLGWPDLVAYLDWAGLRPMSELEFERAARGPYRAAAGEFAWGTATFTRATSISNGGTSTEAPGNAANITWAYDTYLDVGGPLRVGGLAYGDTTRITAGAGYYGNMELSGNAQEKAVTVGNTTGRAFEGKYHGNGALDATGYANVSTWPSVTSTISVGQATRGGSFAYGCCAQISDRTYAAYADGSRFYYSGGRGVRNAP